VTQGVDSVGLISENGGVVGSTVVVVESSVLSTVVVKSSDSPGKSELPGITVDVIPGKSLGVGDRIPVWSTAVGIGVGMDQVGEIVPEITMDVLVVPFPRVSWHSGSVLLYSVHWQVGPKNPGGQEQVNSPTPSMQVPPL